MCRIDLYDWSVGLELVEELADCSGLLWPASGVAGLGVQRRGFWFFRWSRFLVFALASGFSEWCSGLLWAFAVELLVFVGTDYCLLLILRLGGLWVVLSVVCGPPPPPPHCCNGLDWPEEVPWAFINSSWQREKNSAAYGLRKSGKMARSWQ